MASGITDTKGPSADSINGSITDQQDITDAAKDASKAMAWLQLAKSVAEKIR